MSIFDDLLEKDLSLIPVKDAVIFPDTLNNLTLQKKDFEGLISQLKIGIEILAVAFKNLDVDQPKPEDLYKVGVKGVINQILDEDGIVRILFESKTRVNLEKITKQGNIFKARYKTVEKDISSNEEIIALKNNFLIVLNRLINSGKVLPIELIFRLPNIKETNELIDSVIPFIEADIPAKQEVLEEVNLEKRLKKANDLMMRAVRIMEIEKKIESDTQKEMSKAQKDFFLREELKTIQKQLGEEGEEEYEVLKKKIDEAKMPQDIYEIAKKELNRLQKMPVISPEVSYIRSYLDLLIEIPWAKKNDKKIDLKEARKILDQDHFGLDKVKERILEYLAVQKMVGNARGPILCFVGPPGTGKTSVGQSIAKALGRNFVRISLGGIHDEAEIRGHRRTYVGAMPGRIIQGIRRAGSKNPVFMLDEIDKVGMDFRGDPSAALLEALDPEQNSHFSDHYLEVPYDLSDVLFITTANVLDTIPPALLDRMEVINFPGYSTVEKFQIAKKFIIPKVIKANGIKTDQFNLSDEAIKEIIEGYTLEAGVRNLERTMSQLARKIAVKVNEGKKIPKKLETENIKEFLGPTKIEKWAKEIKSQIGLVAGLAVTSGGGEALSVEANLMPGGKGDLILTGQLGEVMKESARIALSFSRSISNELRVDPKIIKENDIHIHVPVGAIPKDGPSAGIAIATAISSAIAKRPVRHDIGMTGEITLRGRVLRIGGVKEKVLAAKRAGLKKVILPESNRVDIEDLDKETLNGIRVEYVNEMKDVLKKVLE